VSKPISRVLEQKVWQGKIKTRAKIDELKFQQAAEKEFIRLMTVIMKDDIQQEQGK
jgi:hypothetical protein